MGTKHFQKHVCTRAKLTCTNKLKTQFPRRNARSMAITYTTRMYTYIRTYNIHFTYEHMHSCFHELCVYMNSRSTLKAFDAALPMGLPLASAYLRACTCIYVYTYVSVHVVRFYVHANRPVMRQLMRLCSACARTDRRSSTHNMSTNSSYIHVYMRFAWIYTAPSYGI